MKQLGPDNLQYWLGKGAGPAMASVAHAMSARLTDCLTASGQDIKAMNPLSTHPLLEPRFSSLSLRLHHDGERTSRMAKVRTISTWPGALETLRVCFYGKPGRLNCGVCPKCIRTKLELTCAGSLHRTSVFENDGLSVRLILDNFRFTSGSIVFLRALVRGLLDSGHTGLAAAVAAKAFVFHLRRLARPVLERRRPFTPGSIRPAGPEKTAG